jgi:hypothetical protein
MKTIKEILQTWTWEDYSLVAFIIITLIVQFIIVSGFKQLPSPLYGGDYYNQLGQTNHIRYGGNILENSVLLGNQYQYFPFYSIIAAAFSNFFNANTIKTELMIAPFFSALSLIAAYLLFKNLFKSKIFGLIGALIYFNIGLVIVKYTDMTLEILVPLFLLMIFFMYERKEIKYSIWAGVVLAIISFSHSIGFVAMFLLLIMFSIYILFLKYVSKGFVFNKKEFKENFWKTILLLFIVYLIAVPVALGTYWYDPIFKYYGKPVNDLSGWGEQDLNVPNSLIPYTIELLGVLFSLSTFYRACITILFITGIIMLFLLKEHNVFSKYIKFLFIVATILSFHYLITVPLIHTELSPSYMYAFLMEITIAVFVCFAIKMLLSINKNDEIKKILIILIIIFFIGKQIYSYQTFMNDKWTAAGKESLPPQLVAASDWLVKNTDVNDVIITNNEISFALNALSGRKFVTMRITHAGLFTDVNTREKDAALLLYGNNSETKNNIIKKYKVKYLYWDYYWINSEYNFNENGTIKYWFDPLMIIYNPLYEQELKDDGVKYIRQTTWVDASNRGPKFQQQDVLMITPDNYYNFTNPWSLTFNPLLKETWSYSQNGQKIAVIYTVGER